MKYIFIFSVVSNVCKYKGMSEWNSLSPLPLYLIIVYLTGEGYFKMHSNCYKRQPTIRTTTIINKCLLSIRHYSLCFICNCSKSISSVFSWFVYFIDAPRYELQVSDVLLVWGNISCVLDMNARDIDKIITIQDPEYALE